MIKKAALTEWLVVVPARLGSERLARKPLQDLGGVPLIIRVAQNLRPLAELGATLVVATDAEVIVDLCAKHGFTARMTSAAHQSGTDRVAEVAAAHQHPFVLNVQGDEPQITADDLVTLMTAFAQKPTAAIGTLVYRASDPKVAADPNTVKAIRTTDGWGLYFSRAAIPYDRGAGDRQHLPAEFWHHLGVYAFRREQLQKFVRLPPSPLEQTERLEQLRALEAGWPIWLEPAATFARGIDTQEDLDAARALLARTSGQRP